ncbi:MAG: c-type cytochrome [Acidovorax sp.]
MKKTLTTMVALAVASATVLFQPMAQAQEVKGDAAAGEKKIAMCIGCHGIVGYQASFPQIHKVPMISGQGAKYIASALDAYRKGDRKHPTMRGIADSLTDQDIADVAAYYAQSGVVAGAELPAKPTREPSAAVAKLLQKGACVTCHGENFAKPMDATYPKIAGQHADYLFVALKAYKGEGNANVVGRSNGVMAGVVKQFSNAELKALADYIGSVDGDLKTVPESRFR